MANQSNAYNIDWLKLVKLLLPNSLNIDFWVYWCYQLLAGHRSLYAKKQAWRTLTRYRANHSGQVIYLEKVLNEYYGVSGYDPDDHVNTRTIYIADGERRDYNYFYPIPDDKPIYFGGASTPYFYSESEHRSFFAQFIIMVPVALTYNESEMRRLVDYYIGARQYKIETY